MSVKLQIIELMAKTDAGLDGMYENLKLALLF